MRALFILRGGVLCQHILLKVEDSEDFFHSIQCIYDPPNRKLHNERWHLYRNQIRKKLRTADYTEKQTQQGVVNAHRNVQPPYYRKDVVFDRMVCMYHK